MIPLVISASLWTGVVLRTLLDPSGPSYEESKGNSSMCQQILPPDKRAEAQCCAHVQMLEEGCGKIKDQCGEAAVLHAHATAAFEKQIHELHEVIGTHVARAQRTDESVAEQKEALARAREDVRREKTKVDAVESQSKEFEQTIEELKLLLRESESKNDALMREMEVLTKELVAKNSENLGANEELLADHVTEVNAIKEMLAKSETMMEEAIKGKMSVQQELDASKAANKTSAAEVLSLTQELEQDRKKSEEALKAHESMKVQIQQKLDASTARVESLTKELEAAQKSQEQVTTEQSGARGARDEWSTKEFMQEGEETPNFPKLVVKKDEPQQEFDATRAQLKALMLQVDSLNLELATCEQKRAEEVDKVEAVNTELATLISAEAAGVDVESRKLWLPSASVEDYGWTMITFASILVLLRWTYGSLDTRNTTYETRLSHALTGTVEELEEINRLLSVQLRDLDHEARDLKCELKREQGYKHVNRQLSLKLDDRERAVQRAKDHLATLQTVCTEDFEEVTTQMSARIKRLASVFSTVVVKSEHDEVEFIASHEKNKTRSIVSATDQFMLKGSTRQRQSNSDRLGGELAAMALHLQQKMIERRKKLDAHINDVARALNGSTSQVDGLQKDRVSLHDANKTFKHWVEELPERRNEPTEEVLVENNEKQHACLEEYEILNELRGEQAGNTRLSAITADYCETLDAHESDVAELTSRSARNKAFATKEKGELNTELCESKKQTLLDESLVAELETDHMQLRTDVTSFANEISVLTKNNAILATELQQRDLINDDLFHSDQMSAQSSVDDLERIMNYPDDIKSTSKKGTNDDKNTWRENVKNKATQKGMLPTIDSEVNSIMSQEGCAEGGQRYVAEQGDMKKTDMDLDVNKLQQELAREKERNKEMNECKAHAEFAQSTSQIERHLALQYKGQEENGNECVSTQLNCAQQKCIELNEKRSEQQTEWQSQIDKLHRELAHEKKRRKEQGKNNADMAAELREMQKELEQEKKHGERQVDGNANMAAELLEAREELEEKKGHMKQQMTQNADMAAELRNVQKELEQEKEQKKLLAEGDADRGAELRESRKELEEEKEVTQKRVKERANMAAELHEARKELQKEKECMRQQMRHNANMEVKLRETRKELEQEREKTIEQDANIADMETQLREAQEKLEQEKEHTQQLASGNADMEAQLRIAHKDLEEEKKCTQEATAENARIVSKHHCTQLELAEQDKKRAEEQRVMEANMESKLNDATQDLEREKKHAGNLNKDKVDLEAKLRDAHRLVESGQEHAARLEDKMMEMEARFNEKESERMSQQTMHDAEVETQLNSLQKAVDLARKQVQQLEKEKSEVDNALQSLNAELVRAVQCGREKGNEKATVEAKLREVERERDLNAQRIKQLEGENESVRVDLNSARKQRVEHDAKRDEEQACMEVKMNDLQKNLEHEKKQNKKQAKIISDIETALSKTAAELTAEKQRTEELQKGRDEDAAQWAQSDADTATLVAQSYEREMELESLKEAFAELEQKLALAEDHLAEEQRVHASDNLVSKTEFEELMAKNQMRQEQLVHLSDALDTLKAEAYQWQTSDDGLFAEVGTLTQQPADVQGGKWETLVELQTEVECIQELIETEEPAVKNREDAAQVIAERDSLLRRISQMDPEVVAMDGREAEWEARVEAIRLTENELRGHLISEKCMRDEHENRLQLLEQVKNQLIEELETERKKSADLEATLITMKEAEVETRQEIDYLVREVDERRENLELGAHRLKNVESELLRARSEQVELFTALKVTTVELHECQEHLSHSSKRLSESEVDSQKLHVLNQQLLDEVDEEANAQVELCDMVKEMRKNIETREHALKLLRQERAELEAECDELAHRVDVLEKECAELKSVARAREQVAAKLEGELQAENAKADTMSEHMRKREENLMAATARFEGMKAEFLLGHDGEPQQIHALKKEIRYLENQNAELVESVSRLGFAAKKSVREMDHKAQETNSMHQSVGQTSKQLAEMEFIIASLESRNAELRETEIRLNNEMIALRQKDEAERAELRIELKEKKERIREKGRREGSAEATDAMKKLEAKLTKERDEIAIKTRVLERSAAALENEVKEATLAAVMANEKTAAMRQRSEKLNTNFSMREQALRYAALRTADNLSVKERLNETDKMLLNEYQNTERVMDRLKDSNNIAVLKYLSNLATSLAKARSRIVQHCTDLDEEERELEAIGIRAAKTFDNVVAAVCFQAWKATSDKSPQPTVDAASPPRSRRIVLTEDDSKSLMSSPVSVKSVAAKFMHGTSSPCKPDEDVALQKPVSDGAPSERMTPSVMPDAPLQHAESNPCATKDAAVSKPIRTPSRGLGNRADSPRTGTPTAKSPVNSHHVAASPSFMTKG